MELDRKFLSDDGQSKNNSSTPSQNGPYKTVGWTWLVFLAGFGTTIGSAIPIGFTIGVLNTPSGIIQKWVNESLITRYDFAVNATQMEMIWSGIVSIFLIGGMIGSMSGGCLADKFGRKGALLLGGAMSFVTGILFVLTKPLNSVELMFLARFLAGLSGGMIMPIMPMYLTELAPIQLRGAVGSLCPLGLNGGVVIAQVLGLPQLLEHHLEIGIKHKRLWFGIEMVY